MEIIIQYLHNRWLLVQQTRIYNETSERDRPRHCTDHGLLFSLPWLHNSSTIGWNQTDYLVHLIAKMIGSIVTCFFRWLRHVDERSRADTKSFKTMHTSTDFKVNIKYNSLLYTQIYKSFLDFSAVLRYRF